MRSTLFAIAAAALAGLAGCATGAPPGFSPGNRWSFPLVDALDDGLLITPVYVDGKGPYLFAIDPDSKLSSIDTDLAHEIHPVRGYKGPHIDDESDTQRPTILVETRSLKLGNLEVAHKTLLLRENHTFDTAGRRIRGLIGRDVIADSLVFGFDRDAGIAYLSTQEGFRPPANAASMKFALLTSHLNTPVPPTGRRLLTAQIDGVSYKLHLDLGGPVSELREKLWPKAHLAALPIQTHLIDEVGTTWTTKHATVASSVQLGAITRGAVFFAPYEDRRWYDYDLDGTLGLNFFRPFAVAVNWDAQKVFLTERQPVRASTGARVSRWGEATFAGCPHLGCADAQITDAAPVPQSDVSNAPGMTPSGSGGVAPTAGPELAVTRDPAAASLDLDLTLLLTPPAGGAMLPMLAVSLPRGTDQVSLHLPPEFAGATAEVVDVSPFPRTCADGGGCVQVLQTPR